MTSQRGRIAAGVTGANGQLGKAVLAHLFRMRPPQMHVTAFTRSAISHPQVAHMADVLAVADFAATEDELAQNFSGLDILLLVSIEGEDVLREQMQATAVRAAARAGVGRIIYTSFFDVQPDSPSRVAKVHRCTEEAILRTGSAWTFLRNGPYLENAVLRMAHAARHSGVFRMAAGNAHLPFISRDDLAFAAATAIVGTGHERKAYRLAGPELMSFQQLAELVGAKLDMPIRYEPIGDEAYRAELEGSALAPEMIARRIAYVQAMRQGFMTALSPDFEQLTGRTPTAPRDALLAMDLSSEQPLH